ncbi:MAG: aminotransferase class IV [Gammaproteobacteria bacterium]
MSESICYLNGEWQPLAHAKVSVLDRGFIFGDGIYEVIPVFAGAPFRMAEHIRRLETNLVAVSMLNPFAIDDWKSLIGDLIARNGSGDQSVYLQVTRGAAPRNHVPRDPIEQTIFLMSMPSKPTSEPAPIAAITMMDFRWQHCDIKSTSLIANVKARFNATNLGSDEAIFMRDGYVTEGAASNVFAVINGQIRTPPLSNHILPGVTRNLLVELLNDSELNFSELMISDDELSAADEIWVTSSGNELLPVGSINDRLVGNGARGPLFDRVLGIYQNFKLEFAQSIE